MAPPPPTSARPSRRARAVALGLALAALVGPSPARAQDAPPEEPPAEGDPLRPVTPVQLRVEPADGGLWKMTLTNRSDATWRVAADARLLTVELLGSPLPDLVARKQKGGGKSRAFPRAKLARCQMPAGMRPSGITPARSLVLRPGERYVETVHPVALCGAAAILDSMGPGAVVYPSFGTPEKRKKNAPPRPLPPPPYVAEPLREQQGAQPIRWLEATPFVVPAPPETAPSEGERAAPPPAGDPGRSTAPAAANASAPAAANAPAPAGASAPAPAAANDSAGAATPAPGASSRAPASPATSGQSTPSAAAPPAAGSAPAQPPPPDDDFAPRLTLQSRRRADAANARNAVLSATLRNGGKTPATMRLRPDALVFRVVPPGAARPVECGYANARRASVRDFFTTLGVGKAQGLTAILGEICPSGSLERPGVYEVWPRVELHETGERFDLAAVSGSFAASSPTLLRVRSGDLPYHDRPPEALGGEGEARPQPPADAPAPTAPGKGPDAPGPGAAPTAPAAPTTPAPPPRAPSSAPSAPGAAR